MNQDKFTIQLDAKAENFKAVADSVRELGEGLKSVAPELDSMKRTLDGLSSLSGVSATLTDMGRTAGKLTDEFVRMERATRGVRSGVGDLDEELSGARITAGSLADAMGRLRAGSVRLEDALSGASNATDESTDSYAAAARELDDLRASVTRLERALEDMTDAANRADNSTRGVGSAGASAGGGLDVAAVAGAAAGVAMVGLTVAMEGVKKGFEFASTAVTEYMATTQQGQRDIALVTFEFQQLKNAIGESVTNSDLFRDALDKGVEIVNDLTEIIPPLVNTLDNYFTAANAAWEATEGVRNAMQSVGEFANRLNPFAAAANAITFIGGVALDAANTFEEWGQEIRDTEAALEDQTETVYDLTSVWSDASAAINDARNATGGFADQWNRIRDSLFGNNEVAITPVVSSGGGGSVDNSAELERDKAIAALNAIKTAELELAQIQAELETNSSLKTLALIQSEKDARIAAIEEQSIAAEEAATRQAELEAELMAARKAEIAEYTDFAKQGYADVTSTLANSIATSELAFGKSSKSATKSLGDSLVSLGNAAKAAAIIKGIGDPSTGFFPNPVGAGAMFIAAAAATKLGRAFGGGGEQAIAAPRELPDNVQQQSNQTSNNYINLSGVIGNRDEIARTIAGAINQGRRNGIDV